MTTKLQYGERIMVKTSGTVTLLCTVASGPTFCQSCGFPMYFVKTPADKPMPIDPPDDEGVAEPHFATCAQGKAWSGKTRADAEAPGRRARGRI